MHQINCSHSFNQSLVMNIAGYRIVTWCHFVHSKWSIHQSSIFRRCFSTRQFCYAFVNYYSCTSKQSKASGSHAEHSYCHLVNQHWDACAVCTTQVLEPCAGKSSGGRASNPQEDCPGLMERGCGTLVSTMTNTTTLNISLWYRNKTLSKFAIQFEVIEVFLAYPCNGVCLIIQTS